MCHIKLLYNRIGNVVVIQTLEISEKAKSFFDKTPRFKPLSIAIGIGLITNFDIEYINLGVKDDANRVGSFTFQSADKSNEWLHDLELSLSLLNEAIENKKFVFTTGILTV